MAQSSIMRSKDMKILKEEKNGTLYYNDYNLLDLAKNMVLL